jgi:hypothetical protein
MKPLSDAPPTASGRSLRPGMDRPPTAEERRRAQRVLLRMAVVMHVADKAYSGHTHTVSASGAMIVLSEPLKEGTAVTIENLKTQAQVEARVVRPPNMTGEGWLVPVQFSTASPRFWNVFFPPAVN